MWTITLQVPLEYPAVNENKDRCRESNPRGGRAGNAINRVIFLLNFPDSKCAPKNRRHHKLTASADTNQWAKSPPAPPEDKYYQFMCFIKYSVRSNRTGRRTDWQCSGGSPTRRSTGDVIKPACDVMPPAVFLPRSGWKGRRPSQGHHTSLTGRRDGSIEAHGGEWSCCLRTKLGLDSASAMALLGSSARLEKPRGTGRAPKISSLGRDRGSQLCLKLDPFDWHCTVF